MIEDLPLLMPDAARSARTAAKCHDRLAARRQKPASPNRAGIDSRRRVVERLLVAGFCVVYLIAMAGEVLAIVGAL